MRPVPNQIRGIFQVFSKMFFRFGRDLYINEALKRIVKPFAEKRNQVIQLRGKLNAE
jgi:hypothetical protein